MPTKKRPRSLREKIESELEKSTISGINVKRIDLESLKQRNAPIARVISEFVSSSTYRDNPDDLAQKIELVLTARDDNSELAKALDELKKELE